MENELLNKENEGLRKALTHKKKQKKKGRALDLQQHEEYWGGAVVWSPRAIREARYRMSVRDEEEARLKAEKETAKQIRDNNKILNQKLADEKRVGIEKRKEERLRKKAENDAEKERKKQERDARKAVQQPQLGKRKASAISAPKAKRVRRFGDKISGNRWVEAPSAAGPSVSQRGRTTKPRKIYE